MIHKRVGSSNIHSIAWENNVLEIRFIGKGGATGSLYEYKNVPQRLYIAFLKSESKGKFFISHIKDNVKYPFKKLGD